jgi:integrase
MTANEPARRRHRANGDGSVYKRQDGYWVGAFYTYTTSGARKRVVVYGKTLDEARNKLGEAQQKARSGVPVPDQSWRLDAYLRYWLEHIVKNNRRPATYALYETNIRLYLIPGLGKRQLSRLSVSAVQMFLNQRLEAGDSVRKVQIMRTVLSAALTRAVREELIVRNVARLAELPQYQRGTIRPWSADEAKRFLAAARPDPLYPAFVLLLLYGLRRGESLGLCWSDINLDAGTLHIRQQLQRIRGDLHLGPVKTNAGRRALPLLQLAREALELQSGRQAAYRADMGSAWPARDLVFTTRTGRPVEPRNLVRSFRRICEDNGLRTIKVHHLRHTVGSLLKDLHVPPSDAQRILGHTRISTTLEIYTDTDEQASRDALTRLHRLLNQSEN